MFLQKSGLGRQILLSRTCPGKKFCHRNNYYYYLGVTYYCTSSLLSPIIPSTEFPSATHDYFNRGCKVFKSGNKYQFSLECYMMFICLYFLFLFSWSNTVAQRWQFATFPYIEIEICRDHPRKLYKGVTDYFFVGAAVSESISQCVLFSSSAARALSSWFVFNSSQIRSNYLHLCWYNLVCDSFL